MVAIIYSIGVEYYWYIITTEIISLDHGNFKQKKYMYLVQHLGIFLFYLPAQDEMLKVKGQSHSHSLRF